MDGVVDGYNECEVDSRAAAHCDAGAMDDGKRKGMGASRIIVRAIQQCDGWVDGSYHGYEDVWMKVTMQV